jgi:predicted DNA-binding protein
MNKIFSFQVPEKLYKALETVAKQEDRSKAYIVRDLIEQYITDYVDLKYAKQVVSDIDSGKTELIDFEDVMRKYGLEG